MSKATGKELEGKLAIVTGASRGIGAAISEVLARKGASVVLNYTSPSSKKRTADLAERLGSEYGVKTHVVQADLGSEDGPSFFIGAVKEWARDKMGGNLQIDIIVHNAGVSVNRPIEECDAEDFAFQYNVNVRGPLLLMKAALPYLPHDRSGRIVNISSVSATLGFIGQSVYGGTKAALEAMTRTWARELAERATVNAVNPGPVATDMYGMTSPEFQARIKPFLQTTPLAKPRDGIDKTEFVQNIEKTGGRPAYESEVAGLVGLLCSPEASFSTGSVLNANGGMKFSS